MAKKGLQPWKRAERFPLVRNFKTALMAFLVIFALCSLLSAGVSLSRSSLMDMAMNQYLFHKGETDSLRRIIHASAVYKHSRVAASRELLFLFISLLTSWTSSTAAYYFLESREDAEIPPCRRDFSKLFLTLRLAVVIVLAYGFVLEMAVLMLLRNSGGSASFLAAAVVVASAFRILSFSLGTVLGQALTMSAIDGEATAGIDALRRPLRFLVGCSPASDHEIPV